MSISKKEIIDFFYMKHLKIKEIADIVNTSSAYITKVVKEDARYNKEKEYRKSIAKEKRRIAQNNFVKKKREHQRIRDNYSILKIQHEQAVKELSKGKYLTNENYRKWNYSAYKYNPLKKRYEFDAELGRTYNVPKYIKER